MDKHILTVEDANFLDDMLETMEKVRDTLKKAIKYFIVPNYHF